MDKIDILQDISVDLSQLVKKHLKNIKKLDPQTQREFGKLFGDMKDGIDDLSENVDESNVNEGKNDFMARGMNTNIHIKNQPNEDLSEKLYYDIIDFMKKKKFSPNEIIIKF